MTNLAEPDYNGALRAATLRNTAEIQRRPRAPWVKEKIRSGLSRKFLPCTDEDVEAVCAQLPSNPLLAALLAKDPTRQSLHQKTAFDFISARFPAYEQLPAGGPGALFVKGGTVVNAAGRGGVGGGKSIDGRLVHEGLLFYALHKYTKDEGGAQDNQFNDALHFVTQGRDSHDRGVFFVALCDGPYYDRAHSPGVSRRQYLTNSGNGRNVGCMTTGAFVAGLLDGTFARQDAADRQGPFSLRT